MKPRAIWTLALPLAFLFYGCNTGSETGNPTKGLAGTIRTQDGQLAARTLIYLVPNNFDPLNLAVGDSSRLRIDTTDSKGRYQIIGLDSGIYNLEAVGLSNQSRVSKQGISVSGSITNVPAQTLLPTGKIALTLDGLGDSVPGYVYIQGTIHYQKVSQNGSTVILDQLPAGKVDSLLYGKPKIGGHIAIAKNLKVASDSTTTIAGAYVDWQRSLSVPVNTTASGIPISGHLTRIPLRISLSQAGFDFTGASIDGSDLRATNERGMPLACEIQSWDVSSRKGDVWVLMDTLFTDKIQVIRLYWDYRGPGKPPQGLPAGSVFSTADGFVAAWHMDQDPFQSSGTLSDASGSKNDAAALGYAAPGTPSPGIIGNSMAFDGKSQSVSLLKQLDSPDIFTISGWFRTSSAIGGMLFEFADTDTSLTQNYWDRLVQMHPDGTLHYGLYPPKIPSLPMPTGGDYQILNSALKLNDGQWHHVAARLYGSGQTFFIDGNRVDHNPSIKEGEHLRGYWRLGYGLAAGWGPVGTSHFFQGEMDEVWIAHGARSDDYIKITYENQKPGSRLFKVP